MLKFFFWVLLAANVVLFVFQQTYFDAPSSGKHEPERLSYQYREDQIRLLSTDEINRAIAKAQVISQDMTTAGTCVEIGHFSKTEAIGFEQQLPSLSLRPENISFTSAQEGSTYMVFIPPPASQKAAEARIGKLKQKGIESYIIKDQTKLRWAISLGIFKTHEAAINHVATLEKAGISDLQIAPRGAITEKRVYRLNNLSGEQLRALESIMSKFPKQSLQHCPPASKNPA